VGGSVSI